MRKNKQTRHTTKNNNNNNKQTNTEERCVIQQGSVLHRQSVNFLSDSFIWKKSAVS